MSQRISANMALDSIVIGEDSKNWKHSYISNDDVPHCDIDNKIIYSPMFGIIKDEKDDIIVRGKNIHEAAHARLTPANKDESWSPLKANLVNALEDCRIEKAVSDINNVLRNDIYSFGEEMSKLVGKRFSDNLENLKPVNEAICALMINSQGHSILWNMSEKGREYFEKSKDVFEKYKSLSDFDNKAGFAGIPKIADELIRIFEDVKNNQKENEYGSEDKNSDESKNSEKKDRDSENASSKNEENNSSKNEENNSSKNEKNKSDSAKSSSSYEKSEDEEDNNKSEETESSEKSEGEESKDFSEDFEDKDLIEEILKEKIKNICKESKEEWRGYTALKDCDMIYKPEDKADVYKTSREIISSSIDKLSSYTEAYLRWLSRIQKMSNLEHGKIDKKKLAIVGKSLTKKVFYRKKDGIDLDVSVTLLVDESGSTYHMINELRSMTIAFSEVFSKLNIDFEVLGFTTVNFESRDSSFTRSVPLKIKEYKTYNENYNVCKYRLGNIQSEFHNADGESLLIAYNRIFRRRTKRKIIFVLSDGLPDCGAHRFELREHLKKAIKFVRSNGVEVYAFGIGTFEPEEFYGKDNFVYLESIKELGQNFFNSFKEIISKR